MPKVFISYSSKVPDCDIANQLKLKFTEVGIDTFFASDNIKWGEEWSKVIEEEIKSFDFFLVLLSENSKCSDMVLEEIRRAKKLYDFRPIAEKPGILPLRINLKLEEGINYDIDAFLNKFQQRVINSIEEIDLIFPEALNIITRKHSNILPEEVVDRIVKTYSYDIPTPVAPLENPGGAVTVKSPYYIIRHDVHQKDEMGFINEIMNDVVLMRIFAPRQFGKTSLLSKIIDFARKNNQYVAPISLQSLEELQINNLDNLYKSISIRLAKATGRAINEYSEKIKNIWENDMIMASDKFSTFLEDYLLIEIDKPIVLAMDEVDKLFGRGTLSKDFFGKIRSIHDDCKDNVPILQKLKFVIAYSTEAYMAISDVDQSPISNVGIEFQPKDFTEEEVSDLVKRHGLNLKKNEVERLMDQIGGHPFLIRTSLYYLAKKFFSLSSLLENCCKDEGVFDAHLRRHYWNVDRKDGYKEVIKEIIRSKYSTNTAICIKLKAAGLVDGNEPRVKMKYKLYEEYFRDKII